MILDAAFKLSDNQDLVADGVTFPATPSTGALSTNYADIHEISWSGQAQYLHIHVTQAFSHDVTFAAAVWPDLFPPADATVSLAVHRFLAQQTLSASQLVRGADVYLPVLGGISANALPQVGLNWRYLNLFALYSLSLTTGKMTVMLTDAAATQPKRFNAANIT